jgi:molybdate transport system regulatory protein
VEPRAKLWIEKHGRIVISDYRVRLLELIGQTGSLADAAAEMGLSYRRAWGKVREIEGNVGLRLVESAAGGAGGGGSRLTAEGRDLVERYRRFRHAMDDALAREFGRTFPD